MVSELPFAAVVQRWGELWPTVLWRVQRCPVRSQSESPRRRQADSQVRKHQCDCKSDSVTLSSPLASNDELAATSSGGAQGSAAVFTLDGGLGVGENSRNFAALLADNVHEKRVWCLNESLKFVQMLLLGRIGIKKVHLHGAL